MMSERHNRSVAVVSGLRTPFARAGAALRDYSALDLATHAVNGLVQKLGLNPYLVDELVLGSVIIDPLIPQMAREVNFRSVLPPSVSALTLTDNCITSASAIQSVHAAIAVGFADIGIAGGAESMSNAPLMLGEDAGRIWRDFRRGRSPWSRIRALAALRPRHLRPRSYGLAEPSTGMTMGEHTEITVKEWRITREVQDRIAYASHMNAWRATRDGRLAAEIHPLNGLAHDSSIRPDTSLGALARLAPVFDRSDAGSITAGNASPLTDGAATVVLMEEGRARSLGYDPLARISDVISVGIDPADGLLMGPGIAVPRLLERNGLTLDDIDVVEVHEAFAGQVAANIAAWEKGWKSPAIGKLVQEKLNPLGSSIAIGHPLAATGARIVTTLANELHRRNSRYGLASICGAGGTASALLLERP